jgi:hypothetical protein
MKYVCYMNYYGWAKFDEYNVLMFTDRDIDHATEFNNEDAAYAALWKNSGYEGHVLQKTESTRMIGLDSPEYKR